MSTPEFDVIIVGSGPSGVQAAWELIRHGHKVAIIDIGFSSKDEPSVSFPEKSFSEIRRTSSNQTDLFLGKSPEQTLAWQKRAGAHLTPGRRYMLNSMDEVFPTSGDSFFALQSTSVGGLGVSWGSNCFRYTDRELKKIGLKPNKIQPFYKDLAQDIGVSGDSNSDVAPLISDGIQLQPPLPIDTNCERILNRYRKTRTHFARGGFRLGQSALAVLSRELSDRGANPLCDLDFWADLRRSVYRPQYDIEKLKANPNFSYLTGWVVDSFHSSENDVVIRCRTVQGGSVTFKEFRARKLILAAGAINTGKIVLKSFPDFLNSRLPILCNPNFWVASLHLPMLGKPARDQRYSLSQLTGIQEFRDQSIVSHFYSYRSLLFFRLIQDVPLPPTLARIFLRACLTSLTMTNIHFADQQSPKKRLFLDNSKNGCDSKSIVRIEYESSPAENRSIEDGLRKMKQNLFSLRCIPFSTARPLNGASIHYAGTLPMNEPGPFGTREDGRLRGAEHVYIADGSSWNFLPAEGLTFTLMANARRVAQEVNEVIRE